MIYVWQSILSEECKGRMLNCDRIHANIGKTFTKGVLRAVMTIPSLLTTTNYMYEKGI